MRSGAVRQPAVTGSWRPADVVVTNLRELSSHSTCHGHDKQVSILVPSYLDSLIFWVGKFEFWVGKFEFWEEEGELSRIAHLNFGQFNVDVFFLEHAGELRIFILREKEQSNYKIIPHLGP